MPVVIGGEKSWKTFRHGQLGVAFHWINEEPSMVLFPVNKKGAGAFVIGQSSAYKYANNDGYPNLAYMLPTVAKAAEQMGFSSTDTFAVRQISEAILDYLEDLIRMPPEPTSHVVEQAAEAAGELSIKIDGETVMEQEVPGVPLTGAV